jgi:hypothetical protein
VRPEVLAVDEAGPERDEDRPDELDHDQRQLVATHP